MKNFFNDRQMADKIITRENTISLSFIAIQLISIVFSYSHLPLFIPLFNQMPWGEKRLAAKEEIFLPVACALIIVSMNFFISHSFYEKMPLLTRVLSTASLLVCFFTLLIILRTLEITL